MNSYKSGDKLGPYEIVEMIGKGGMGEVYRAHDSRTGRDVAVKVSAERFSERFDREVRAVASLNHPNICTLYDVGPNYLVMEFIEGESPRGPIPVEEALKIARQIGAALEEAHEKGITHRDLKPANIKIKADGTVKVLDFGLAKISQAEAGSTLTENSPTISMAAGTQVGVILGTAGYMSPEQARGKKVDKRADIWAFGVVLHELVTGRRLYDGEDVTEILAKVIQGEPSWEGVPPKVRPLLKSCLEKDPRNRLRDIADGWRLLEGGTEVPLQAKARSTSGAMWVIAAVAVVAVGIALWAPWRTEKVAEKALVRLDVDLGADVSLPPANSGGSDVAISPDGTRLVYASGMPAKLYTRRLDQPKATELPGTEGANSPFFSPDGQWVGFFARNKMNKISVEGGALVPLGEVAIFAGASWGEDGNIVVGQAFSKGLVRMPPGSGPTEALTELANGELAHALPQVLPGGKAVLFSAFTQIDVDKASIEVLTLADRKRKTVVRGGTSAHYVAAGNGSGYLLYTNKATLFAVPFDLEKMEARGTAVPVLDEIAFQSQTGTGQFDLSRTGTLVYRRGGSGGTSGMMTVQWVDSSGKREPLMAKPGVYLDPRLSPDGKRLAMLIVEAGGQDLWVYDMLRDAMTRLTFGGSTFTQLAWSPDGQYVLIGTVGHGIMWTRSDGASQPQTLLPNKSVTIPWSFTPDGKRLVYVEVAGAPQIWTVPVEQQGGQFKAGMPEQFLKSQFVDQAPVFSPDGRWVAYQSNEQGKSEVYVRAFPPPASGQGGKWQISNSGGTFPRWSSKGHDLLYQAGDQIMAAGYAVKGDTFVAEKPRVWLAKLGGANWDLAPDGKRVAVLTPVEAQDTPKQQHEVVFLQNFFDELRRKVPIGK